MDFDDLLTVTVRAVPEHPDVLEPLPASASSTCWSTSTRTPTGPRTSWSSLLGAGHRNVCVVGDRDQSHLPVPGRRHPQHPRVREGVPRRHRDRARAELPVDADDPRRRQRRHRQQPRPQAQGRCGPTRAAASRIVRYHAEDEGDEAAWVAREIGRPARRDGHRWGDMASSTGPTPRAGCVEEELMRARHPVQGRRRHPVLRPPGGQGRARLPAGRRQPGRRGERQAGPQRAQAGRRRHHRRPARRLGRPPTASPFVDALRRAEEAGVTGPALRGHRRASSSCSTSSPTLVPTGPGRRARGRARRSGYLAELEAEHTVEAAGRLENLAELVGVGHASSTDVDEFLEQVSLVADTDELDGDDSRGRADDAAHGQGPRVPGGVPRRPRGRRLPPPALARRARRARGGAPPRLRRHHPGPRAPLPHPRLEPHAVRLDAVQPAQPLPRRDPGRAGRGHRRPRPAAPAGGARASYRGRERWRPE